MKERHKITASAAVQFRKVVESRRSVRRFTDEAIPEEVVNECLDWALLAPNSSNLQMWNFYRITTPALKQEMAKNCMGQSAAKTAAELIVCTASTQNWKAHTKMMLDYWPQEKIPASVKAYYKQLTYINYTVPPLDPFGLLGAAKKTARGVIGLVQPFMREPNTQSDMRLWAHKSTALACENLMLGFRAHGFDTCPMEGFDEARVAKLCKLKRGESVVMVIAAGRAADKGLYHDQFRFERERFVHEL